MRRRLFTADSGAARDGLDVGALAPMVDMMTLLLVFLLRTWSTESAPVPPSGRFELATTTSPDARSRAVTVLISAEAIWVDGHRVIATPKLGPDVLIREVYDPLLAARGAANVEIHADAAVPWAVLKRVIATSKAAGVQEVAIVGASAEGM